MESEHHEVLLQVEPVLMDHSFPAHIHTIRPPVHLPLLREIPASALDIRLNCFHFHLLQYLLFLFFPVNIPGLHHPVFPEGFLPVCSLDFPPAL
jgi:hypothetical protein